MAGIQFQASIAVGAGPLVGHRFVAAIHAPFRQDLALLAVLAPVPHLAGSKWAVGIAEQMLQEEAASGDGPSVDDPGRWLDDTMLRVEERILQAGRGRPSLDGETGLCSLVALITPETLYLHHLGHARPYLLRSGTLIPLAREHVGIPAGSDGRQVTRWLGMSPEGDGMAASAFPVPLFKGDRILLVTDGLYGAVEDHDLANLSTGPWPPEGLAQRLVDAARFRWTGSEQAAACALELVSEGDGLAMPVGSAHQSPVERDEITFRDLSEAAALAAEPGTATGASEEPVAHHHVPSLETKSMPHMEDPQDQPALEEPPGARASVAGTGNGPPWVTLTIIALLLIAFAVSIVLLWFPPDDEKPPITVVEVEEPEIQAAPPSPMVLPEQSSKSPEADSQRTEGHGPAEQPESTEQEDEDPCGSCAVAISAQTARAEDDPCGAVKALKNKKTEDACRRCKTSGAREDLALTRWTWKQQCGDLRFEEKEEALQQRRCEEKIREVEGHRNRGRCEDARKGMSSLETGQCVRLPSVASRIRALSSDVKRRCPKRKVTRKRRPTDPVKVRIWDFSIPVWIPGGD